FTRRAAPVSGLRSGPRSPRPSGARWAARPAAAREAVADRAEGAAAAARVAAPAAAAAAPAAAGAAKGRAAEAGAAAEVRGAAAVAAEAAAAAADAAAARIRLERRKWTNWGRPRQARISTRGRNSNPRMRWQRRSARQAVAATRE